MGCRLLKGINVFSYSISCLGVEVISIAIGDSWNTTGNKANLEDYATSPENVYAATDFVEIKNKIADIISKVCPGMLVKISQKHLAFSLHLFFTFTDIEMRDLRDFVI